MIRSAMSLNAAVWPETYATASPPSVATGTTSFRRRSTSSPVASSCGADVGRDEDDRNGLLVVELRLTDGRHARKPLHAVVDLLRRLLVAVDVDDDRDRAVEAGAESLRQEVVGPAGGLLLGLGALVGRTEADERRRAGEREARHQSDRGTRPSHGRSRSGPSGRSESSPAPPRSRRAGGGRAPSTGRSCAPASPAPRSAASSRSPRS